MCLFLASFFGFGVFNVKKTYQLESPRFVSSFHVVEAFTPGELVLQAREAEGGFSGGLGVGMNGPSPIK